MNGQIIKDRVLTIPTVNNWINLDVLTTYQVNANQLAVKLRVRQESKVRSQILLVYELESILSHSADLEITPRMMRAWRKSMWQLFAIKF